MGPRPRLDPPAGHPALELRLFGPLELRVGGELAKGALRRKALWVVALLALRSGRPVPRIELAGRLWPESEDDRALYNLRRELSALRSVLGPEARRLEGSGSRSIALDLEGARVDVLDFDRLLALDDEASLEAAMELRRGPLLDGCLEDWALEERERRELASVTALERLASAARERGELDRAEGWLARLLRLDPLRERAHRERLEVLASRGEYAAVVDAYRELRRRLRAELGVEPDAATTDLFERVRSEARGRASAGRPTAGRPPHDDAPPLPAPLTGLIGRERERRALAAELEDTRLVTVVGPAGVGKTRLALAVAHGLAGSRAGGVAFASLAQLADAELLEEALAGAVGARVHPGQPAREALLGHLRGRELLLVVDNCEHLFEACARTLAGLLSSAGGLHVLATSRRTLGLAGESIFRLEPLAVPGAEAAATLSAEDCLGYDGVRLFVDRAARATRGFQLDERVAPAVVEVCARLEGLPLALELAAARTRSLAVSEIASGLRDVFGLLGGVQGSPERHQRTLAAALDWSHDLLDPDQRAVLRRLSIFAGAFGAEAAAAVCADGLVPAARIPALVDQLVDRSLLVHLPGENGTTSHFRLLETVRQYGRRELERSGELEALQLAHFGYFEGLAERAAPELFGGFRSGQWGARIRPLRADLRRALERSERTEALAQRALRMAANLQWLWFAEGAYAEGRARLDAALSRAGEPCADRALALVARAYVAFWEGDAGAVAAPLEEALAFYRPRGDERGVAYAASVLSCTPGRDDAAPLADEALAAARRHGDPTLLSIVLWWRGRLQEELADLEGARASYEELLATIRADGHATGVGHALYPLGRVALALGDTDLAEQCFGESLRVLGAIRERFGMLAALLGLAQVALADGRLEDAAGLLGSAEELDQGLGGVPEASEPLRELERALAGALGGEAFEQLRAAGRARDPVE